MKKSFATHGSKLFLQSVVSGALLLLSAVVAQAAPPIPPFFQPISVDGNTTGWMGASAGGPESFLYSNGVFHMWYRTSNGTIGGLNHATSTDGINFTTQGALSFTVNPFAVGTPPDLDFENAAIVGGNFKIIHWTQNGLAGSFPDYDYNNSVTNIGPVPGTLATTHQGRIGPVPTDITGGTSGLTAGSFGIVNNNWYGQCGATGSEVCRAPYTDGTPPTVTPLISVFNANAILASLSLPTGYISNHGDVIAGASGLDAFFTLRDSLVNGLRVNQQVYYANSTNDGVSWTAPAALFGPTPLLNGSPFGSFFSHPDAVFTGTQYFLYVSSTDSQGQDVIAVALTAPAVGPPSLIPTMGTFGLILAGLLLAAIGAGTIARRSRHS